MKIIANKGDENIFLLGSLVAMVVSLPGETRHPPSVIIAPRSQSRIPIR